LEPFAKGLRERLEAIDPEIQIPLYEQQMEFSRFHNGLVWQVSSIFIPFSFAGLGLNFESGANVYYVGWGSIFLLTMWTMLAEWHRWMWVHSFYIAALIERIWKVRVEEPKVPNLMKFSPPHFLGVRVLHFSFDIGRIIRLLFWPVGVGFWLVRMYW
jgi:hypothetical protein